MISQVIVVLILKFCFISESLSKKFILLPYNSPLCNETINGINKFYEFTISQQLNFETNANITSVLNRLHRQNGSETSSYLPWFQIDNNEQQYYFCRILVKPMGRELHGDHQKGSYNFWTIRTRIDQIKSKENCSANLLLQFRLGNSFLIDLEGHSERIENITCNSNLPITIPTNLRKLFIAYFSSSPHSQGFVINVTSYIYFKGAITTQYKQDVCRRQDGFWCNNTSGVCLFRDQRCDGFDSCFDGGSDEMGCPPPNNLTKPEFNFNNKPRTSFIDYLPWLALGILPLILLMALICICNQHRSEVFFDDDEDNLDIEKSQDDNADHMWSSLDGIDQFGKAIEEQNEDEDEENDNHFAMSLVGKEPLIGLQTIHCPATVKAEITTSCTGNSLNKDYEDIDKSIVPSPTTTKTSINTEENQSCLQSSELLETVVPNGMTMSQITDDDYILEDVGSLLRKVDKSKIPEEFRMSDTKPKSPSNETLTNQPPSESVLDYRSDYILV